MYDFIKGAVVKASEEKIVIENDGIGYSINASQASLKNLPDIGEKAKIYVHLEVKEDDLSLYGFASPAERELFKLLSSV